MKELTCVCGEVVVVDSHMTEELCPVCWSVVVDNVTSVVEDSYCDCGRLVHEYEYGY